MSIKSIVHTTGKIKDGGDSIGVIILLYKSILPLVSNAEIAPVINAIDGNKIKTFLFAIKLSPLLNNMQTDGNNYKY